MINPKDNSYAYVGMKLPISSANIENTGYMLNEPVLYTANNVISIMTTGNSNLDGTTGTYYDNITGTSNGTLVKRIIIKAQGNTSQGMVRMFFKAGGSVWLMREIEVPAITQAAVTPTFIAIIDEPFYLKASYLLRFSTENSNTIIVTTEGVDTSYPY